VDRTGTHILKRYFQCLQQLDNLHTIHSSNLPLRTFVRSHEPVLCCCTAQEMEISRILPALPTCTEVYTTHIMNFNPCLWRFWSQGCLKKQNSWRKCRQGTLQLSVHMDLPLATQNHFFQSNPRWITCVHQELIQSMYDNAGLLASSDQRLTDDYWQLPVQLKSFHFWASQLAEAIKCCKLQPGTPMQSKSVRLTWKTTTNSELKMTPSGFEPEDDGQLLQQSSFQCSCHNQQQGAIDVEVLETKLVQERSNSLPEPWILISNLHSVLGSIGSKRQWAPDFGVRSRQGHIEGIWRIATNFPKHKSFQSPCLARSTVRHVTYNLHQKTQQLICLLPCVSQ
jgi:hypothetical protein